MKSQAEAPTSPCTCPDDRQWVELVAKIRSGNPSAVEELYRAASKGVRFLLFRQLGAQDLDKHVDELLLTVTTQIQNGDLQQPERLMGHIREAAQRHVARCLGDRARACHDGGPEIGVRLSDPKPNRNRSTVNHHDEELAHRVLRELNPQDREVLVRYYLDEQPQEQICEEMGLTEEQFRLTKSRAKARFGELGKAQFQPRKGPASWRKYLPIRWEHTA